MSKSRASLIEAYIAALPGTVVSVVASADGRRSRIETGAGGASGGAHARLRFKSTRPADTANLSIFLILLFPFVRIFCHIRRCIPVMQNAAPDAALTGF